MRVLCISPHFAPTNAADCHRIRLLLPYFAGLGCQVYVLAVDAADVSFPSDASLCERLPASVPVHRVRAWRLSGWGMNGLTQRTFVPLYKKGNELLAAGQFDLVFFSTTEFLLHGLGPLWRSRWGVPFCMDFQDPWVNEYYAANQKVARPGGRLKFAIMNKLHRFLERIVVPRAAGFLAVSNAYLAMLDQRYGQAVASQPRLIAAFPAEPSEMTSSRPAGGGDVSKTHIARYIGRGGSDMAVAAGAFFLAWKMALDRGLLGTKSIRFEAIGTSYAAAGQGTKTLAPLAREVNLEDWMQETTDRLNYRDMISALLSSDSLVVFGSDDPAYTASKIFPYLLARRPLLAIFHEKSSVVELMSKVRGGVCVTFGEQTRRRDLATAICEAWFESSQLERTVPLDRSAFEQYTAAAQARQVTDWFEAMANRAR